MKLDKGVRETMKTMADPNVPMFGDPSEYENMSKEEKEEETKRMMGLHKQWSGDTL